MSQIDALTFRAEVFIDSCNRVIVAMDGLRWSISNIRAFELWCEWRRIRRVNFLSYGSE